MFFYAYVHKMKESMKVRHKVGQNTKQHQV